MTMGTEKWLERFPYFVVEVAEHCPCISELGNPTSLSMITFVIVCFGKFPVTIVSIVVSEIALAVWFCREVLNSKVIKANVPPHST